MIVGGPRFPTRAPVFLGDPNTIPGATIGGGGGDDVIFGSLAADMLQGDSGNDVIAGGRANDVINGGAGNDDLFGDPGDDTVDGGGGDDFMSGEAGHDTFRFGAASNAFFVTSGNDVIFDFTRGEDLIEITGATEFNQRVVDADADGQQNDLLLSFSLDTLAPSSIVLIGVTEVTQNEDIVLIGVTEVTKNEDMFLV